MQKPEGNNRMEKTRDLFKKTGDIKGTCHARVGMILDRNSKDLTEAEHAKKRWQDYKELYKKVLMTWITMKVWSLTLNQTSWSVKSSGPSESTLRVLHPRAVPTT